MDKDEFLNFFEENRDQFITGIHNYCDRWCERCPYTTKCSVYAMEFESRGQTGEEQDLENEKFWERFAGMMKLTKELITDFAEEQGIDLEAIDHETITEERRKLEEEADQHVLSKYSWQYVEKNRAWFERNEEIIEQKEQEIQERVELEIGLEETTDEFFKLKDFVEVIKWYTFQIHVKIKRALMHGEVDLEFEDPIQNDKKGSAKVALIGTERSIAAWSGMLEVFKEQEDEILEMLVLLEKIRKGILEEFPDVNKFIRPGFDT